MRKNIMSIFLLSSVGFLLTGETAMNKNPEIMRREIKTEVKNGVIKYKEKIFYSTKKFKEILNNKKIFKSELIKKMKRNLADVSFSHFKIGLDPSKKIVTLKCDVDGAMYSSNSYNMHFILKNWPFDLMNFKRLEKKLVYEEKINGIPALIEFEFPYVIANCHEHVWPEK